MSYRITDTCIGCTPRTKRCPTEAISGERNGIHIIDRKRCIDCGACEQSCGWHAIHIDPPREALKKRLFQPVELLETAS